MKKSFIVNIIVFLMLFNLANNASAQENSPDSTSFLYYWPLYLSCAYVWQLSNNRNMQLELGHCLSEPFYPNKKDYGVIFISMHSNEDDPWGVRYPEFRLAFDFPSKIYVSTNRWWLLADFSVAEGDSFYTGNPDNLWIKVLSRDSTITVEVGTFDHCIVFSNDAYYAPHVGPIKNLIGYSIGTPLFIEIFKEQRPPAAFTLYQNYPNPFNSATQISFDLSESGPLKLSVIDLMGREVRTLIDGSLAAGEHRTFWDGTNDQGQVVPSGVYLIRLKNCQSVQTIKAVVQR